MGITTRKLNNNTACLLNLSTAPSSTFPAPPVQSHQPLLDDGEGKTPVHFQSTPTLRNHTPTGPTTHVTAGASNHAGPPLRNIPALTVPCRTGHAQTPAIAVACAEPFPLSDLLATPQAYPPAQTSACAAVPAQPQSQPCIPQSWNNYIRKSRKRWRPTKPDWF